MTVRRCCLNSTCDRLRIIDTFRHLRPTFAAIDFETAGEDPTSACALGVARVEDGALVAARSFLIRPACSRFPFARLHGISRETVAGAPPFGEVWDVASVLLRDVHFPAAHHASFDGRVLRACCLAAHRVAPSLPFLCTVRLARERWGVHPTRLPDVCWLLGIPLRHHDPLHDAEACARIVLAADPVLRRAARVGTATVEVAGRTVLRVRHR